MPSRTLFLLTWGLLVLAAAAAAQVGGTVTGPDARPVPDATVELWGTDARLGSTVTDAGGRFRFPAGPSDSAKTVAVRRIGYAPLTRAVTPPASLEVRLEALAVSLPELRSGTVRRVCPNREDPAARALWEAGRRRYDEAFRGTAFVGLTWDGTLDPEEVGLVDEARMQRFTSVVGGQPVRLERLVERWGYASPKAAGWVPWGMSWDDFFAWAYPSLHDHDARHFADQVFGRLHTLSVQARGGGETTLAFCPRDRSRPSIEGTLVVGADTAFHSAAWSFRTPKPREDAGGEVVFAPPSSARWPLLPARGTFWRRLGGSRRYWQRTATYTAWIVSPDSTMPPAPMPRPR
jgi:hypothetical protein